MSTAPTHSQVLHITTQEDISCPWVLINKRAALRQQGKLSQLATHLIGRQITAGLKGDRAKWAAVAMEKIEGHLAAREPKEAW